MRAASLPLSVAPASFPEQTTDLARLPSLLAIPLQEYRAERHFVMRLQRLCDAAEHLTRFCAIVTLAELRRRSNDRPLPDLLLRELRPQIERPTFGKWRGILEALVKTISRNEGLVLPELPGFITQQLLPRLDGGDSEPSETSLLTLRNLLVHGGGMTQDQAKYFLHGSSATVSGAADPFEGWEPRLAALTQQSRVLW